MSVSKLVMEFATAYGETATLSYNYAKVNASEQSVRALASGIIANGSIFAKVPTATKSAKIVTTTETPFNLDA